MIQRYFISQPWNAGKVSLSYTMPRDFRMTELRTNIVEQGKASIYGIYIEQNFNNNSDSLLLGTLDCYEISSTLLMKLQSKFEKEHNLIGIPDSEIDNYLDEHELEYPKLMQLSIPTVSKGEIITIKGETVIDYQLTLVGYAKV